MAMNPLLILGLGAGALVLLGSKKAKASPTSSPPGGVPLDVLPTDVTPPGASPPGAVLPTYVVKQDDYPTKIAKAFTGSESRWRELIQANPQKPVAKTGKYAGSFATLYAGERINLPASWVR